VTGLSQRLVRDVGRRADDRIAFPAIARSRTEENIDIALDKGEKVSYIPSIYGDSSERTVLHHRSLSTIHLLSC
jgi:hypothetical protein